MDEPFLILAATLASRMLAVAAVVVIASLLVERVGPVVGAMVASLPISAGPAYLFLALDHSPVFVAESAVSSLLPVASVVPFGLTYIAVARQAGTVVSLGAALAAWVASLVLLAQRSWTMPEALVLTLAFYAVGIAATGPARRLRVRMSVRAGPLDIAVRAGTVMVLMAAVTLAGRWFGPRIAGLIALVPIVFSSLILIMQPRVGPDPMRAVLANSLVGMASYGVALAIINLAAVPLGSGPALLGALATIALWNGGFILWPRLRRRPA